MKKKEFLESLLCRINFFLWIVAGGSCLFTFFAGLILFIDNYYHGKILFWFLFFSMFICLYLLNMLIEKFCLSGGKHE